VVDIIARPQAGCGSAGARVYSPRTTPLDPLPTEVAVIRIVHRHSGETLHNVQTDTLAGADLRGLPILFAQLAGCDLVEADLRGAELSNSDLTGARLGASDWSGATANNVDFDGADLAAARFVDGKFLASRFRAARMAGLDATRASCMWANLTDVDAANSLWQRADLSRTTLRGARFAGSDLGAADLRWADLTGADLRGCNLTAANLTGARLCDAVLDDAELALANLNGADLANASLSGSILSRTVLTDCRNLDTARGLDAVRHWSDSWIDARTLAGLRLPAAFVEGLGQGAPRGG
jgi:uncharacterized protein YjbI with pentapeptide repeats